MKFEFEPPVFDVLTVYDVITTSNLDKDQIVKILLDAEEEAEESDAFEQEDHLFDID